MSQSGAGAPSVLHIPARHHCVESGLGFTIGTIAAEATTIR